MEALNIDWGSHKNEKEDDIGVSVKEDTKEMQELNVFGEAKSIESVERKTKEETEEEFKFDSSELMEGDWEEEEPQSELPKKSPSRSILFTQDIEREEVDSNDRENNSSGEGERTRSITKSKESGAHRSSEEVGNSSARGISQDKTTTKEITIREPSAIATAADVAKFLALSARFEQGREIVVYREAGESKIVMSFLQVGNELMAFRVFDPSPVVRIPAFVADLPVKYLHPEFLKGGLTPFSGIKWESAKSLFNSDKIVSLNRDAVKDSLKGAKGLELPNTLTSLPPRIFEKCLNLKSIVVPASVTAVSNRAFSYSCFSDIWFEGSCPIGFLDNSYMPRGVKIHARKEFLDSFAGGE